MNADAGDARFTLTYSYSRPQIRRYFRRELWRTQGGWMLGLVLTLGIGVLTFDDPAFAWFGGFIAGLASTYFIFLYVSYRRLDQFPIGLPVTTIIGEEGIRFAADFIVSDVPWKSMRQARESRDGLTLRYRFRPGPVLLPAEVVTPEIVAYVQTKIAQNKRGTPQ